MVKAVVIFWTLYFQIQHQISGKFELIDFVACWTQFCALYLDRWSLCIMIEQNSEDLCAKCSNSSISNGSMQLVQYFLVRICRLYHSFFSLDVGIVSVVIFRFFPRKMLRCTFCLSVCGSIIVPPPPYTVMPCLR